MCNFPTIKDAADVAIATMFSGIQVTVPLLNFFAIVSLHVQLLLLLLNFGI